MAIRRLGLMKGLMVILGVTYLVDPFAVFRWKKPVTTPTPPLHEAVREGDMGRVRSLITQGLDINLVDGNGRMSLHETVRYGFGRPWFSRGYVGESAPLIAACLIDHGAHVNAQDFLGMTPLHRAATSNSEPLAALLIDNNAQINVQSLSGQTPLYMAIAAREPNMAAFLIAHQANVNIRTLNGDTALHIAAGHGSQEVVKSLIKAGADIDAVDRDGQSPLYRAFLSRHWILAQCLIDHGAKATGEPPNPDPSILHLAAEYGPPEFTQWLITQGVDLDALNDEGETPLHCALKTRWSPLRFPRTSSEIARHLISAGADMTLPDRLGNSPLHKAVLFGYKGVVETLIFRGASVHSVNQSGQTPLHMTGYIFCRDIVQMLVQAGARVNVADDKGRTPLHRIAHVGCLPALTTLIQAGAFVHAADHKGRTPVMEAMYDPHDYVVRALVQAGAEASLTTAAFLGDLNRVKRLVDGGATVDAQDAQGRTALYWAIHNGDLPTARVLLDHGADIRPESLASDLHLPHELPGDVQTLTDFVNQAAKPYTIIVNDPHAVWPCLAGNSITGIDELWTPQETDTRNIRNIIRRSLEQRSPAFADAILRHGFDRGFVLAHLDRYCCECAGLIRNGRPFIFCNLSLPGEWFQEPPDNQFTYAADGGCYFVRMLIDVESKTVVWAECNGM